MKPMTLLLLTVAAGCTTQNTAEVLPGPTSGLTYYQDAAPILGEKCASCHQPGGIAPFSLMTYAEAKQQASRIKFAVEGGVMPPLPPEQDGCQPLDDERNMTAAQRATLAGWAGGGALEGNAAAAAPVPAPPDLLGPAKLTIDSGVDYLSTFDGNDDYRCFIIDPKLTKTFNLIAADSTSTNRSIVHHVIVYAVLPANVAAAHALDAKDAQAGYECFGGAGVTAFPVAASAVGSKARPFPDSSGAPLPAGTQFVVQVHYNFDNGRGANRLALQLWDGVITKLPMGVGVSNNTFKIPAGAPSVEVSAEGMVTKSGKIWNVFPHMHQLGQSISLELVRADGSKACLMNIPKWDFHWQGSYAFKTPVLAQAGDKIKMICNWNNSAENQPMVNGVQQAPRDVTFGEGSTEEMCLSGVTMTQ